MEAPHDDDAERELLGNLMQHPDWMPDIAGQLAVEDFYRPTHGAIFLVLCDMWAAGTLSDSPAVLVHLRQNNITIDRDVLLACISAPTGGETTTRLCAERVLQCAIARRAALVCQQAASKALTADMPPAELIDWIKSEVAAIDVPADDTIDGYSLMVDARNRAEVAPEPWVIPGIVRRDWRVVIVGAEGVGKGYCLRQMVGCASQGVHPFRFTPIEPVNALLVDAENPLSAIAITSHAVSNAAKAVSTRYDDNREHLFHQQRGINIRNRRDRMNLETVLRKSRPELVCAGPLYKLCRAEKGEDAETAAAEAQDIFDDLRTRYGFALVLEHHAAKGSSGAREMAPFGSSLWLRWPEIGVALKEQDYPDGALEVGRFRRDRVENDWPAALHRGVKWPWHGVWEDDL